MVATQPSYLNFDSKLYPWAAHSNYQEDPEQYLVDKGEQGGLICEPYKTQIGQHWKFRTPDIARQSAERITALFHQYLQEEDFVGADLARKYLQMGFTRSLRDANYKGGNKYDKVNQYALKQRSTGKNAKAAYAEIFYSAWQQAERDPIYQCVKWFWKQTFG